jgi:TATA-box binding protein (TBP) (component of TFIID and TFIIIB)
MSYPLENSINKCNRKLSKLPSDIDLTTTTLTCKIGTTFDTQNIKSYFNDFDKIITGIKKPSDKKKNKTKLKNDKIKLKNDKIKLKNDKIKLKNDKIKLKNDKINNKKNTNPNDDLDNEINDNCDSETDDETDNETNNDSDIELEKPKNNGFRNQVSMVFCAIELMNKNYVKRLKKTNLKLYNKEIEKQINVKIFSNGSFQMTGCKNFDIIIPIFKTLFKKLLKENDKYVTEPLKLKVENIFNFKVRMININFGMNFCVNREILKNLFIEYKHKANFKPLTHPAVNVTYNINNDNVTVLIFNSGSITIAGKNKIENLIDAYYEINNFILTNFKKIHTKKITQNVLINLIKEI